MSKNVAMFVDVANLYYSARGQDVDVDYVALLKHATKGRDLIRAYAYSGLDPENENQRKFIDFLAKNGYRVLTKDIRKFGDGRVKANLDIELVVDLFRLRDRMDIAVIVSGDGDFAPAIRALQEEGVRCEVISFKPNTSSDLIAVADEFIDIMKIAGIGRKKDADKGMPTPEMPAKEVVPEFAFRDASPSVAAAALAALKGGAGRGDGRTRSGRRAPAAPPTEAAGEAPAAIATGATPEADEPRRRRRRRGGRGRGRGRRDGEVLEGVAASDDPAPIGWQELDDLSEIDDLDGLDEEREYSFEEADEATLRELGIQTAPSIADDGGEAVEPDGDATPAAQAAPRPRSRSRRTSTAADVTADEGTGQRPRRRSSAGRTAAASGATPEGATNDDAAQKPAPASRRRTSSRSRIARDAKSGATVESGEAAPEPAPAASTRGRRRQSGQKATEGDRAPSADETSASEPSQDVAPQGIWGRFRSGRS